MSWPPALSDNSKAGIWPFFDLSWPFLLFIYCLTFFKMYFIYYWSFQVFVRYLAISIILRLASLDNRTSGQQPWIHKQFNLTISLVPFPFIPQSSFSDPGCPEGDKIKLRKMTKNPRESQSKIPKYWKATFCSEVCNLINKKASSMTSRHKSDTISPVLKKKAKGYGDNHYCRTSLIFARIAALCNTVGEELSICLQMRYVTASVTLGD